jgi:hypothetical protein
MPHGDGRHYLVVNEAIRDKAGVSTDSIVTATQKRDTAPRCLSIPADFKRALAGDPEARAAFKKLAYSY